MRQTKFKRITKLHTLKQEERGRQTIYKKIGHIITYSRIQPSVSSLRSKNRIKRLDKLRRLLKNESSDVYKQSIEALNAVYACLAMLCVFAQLRAFTSLCYNFDT